MKHLGLRIDEVLLKKFHYLSKYYGRSANSQLIFLIKNAVAKFEQQYGIIDLDTTQEK